MTIQITPELAEAWQLRTTVKKMAKPSSKDKQILIEPFDLVKEFTSQYLAIGVIVPESRDSWQFGGRIAQGFDFFNYSNGYSIKRKAFNFSQELLINKVTFVQFPPITSDSYRISYLPPRYFSEVTIQVWEYQGVTTDQQIESLVTALETSAILTVDFSNLQPTLDSLKQDILTHKNPSAPNVWLADEESEDFLLPGFY